MPGSGETLLDRLNALNRGFADRTNPYGYRAAAGAAPETLDGYRSLFAACDAVAAPYPVLNRTPYCLESTGADVIPALAWHDRVHVAIGADLDAEGELAVFWRQYLDLRDHDKAAAALHLLISFVFALWWQRGGTGNPANVPVVSSMVERRLRRHGTFLDLGRRHSDPHDALAFFERHAGDDFMEICGDRQCNTTGKRHRFTSRKRASSPIAFAPPSPA